MNSQELLVISKAKALAELIYEVTEYSPKKFRFGLVTYLRNTSTDVVMNLYNANGVFVDLNIIADMNKTIKALSAKKDFRDLYEKIINDKKIFSLKIEKAKILTRRAAKRLDYSCNALTRLRQLDWLIDLSVRTECLTAKQQKRLAALLLDTRRLLVGYIKNDRTRYNF